MVNVAEHVYHDDPTVGPADVRTRLSGAEYFFLGNGSIQAAVQFAPDGEGTPLGLLIMDPDRFGKKRDTLTMNPVDGLLGTVVRVSVANETVEPTAATLSVCWIAGSERPTVEARWGTDPVLVVEQFSCPDDGEARLQRRVTIRQAGPASVDVVLTAGPTGTGVSLALTAPPLTDVTVWLEYTLDAARTAVRLRRAEPGATADREVKPHRPLADVRFHEPLLDHLFNAARCQLPVAVSALGRLDGSIWQYNREWVRDQANIAVALTQLGQRELAATMLSRLLTEFVTDDGATIDSSEVRGRDDVELDQNGVLLQALEQYVCWTGDVQLVADHWPRIRALAEYPLREEFRHAPSGMLSGCREYWERHAAHGIEPGLELVYHVSSEPDSPGGWPFASMFVARAAVEAGDSATAWRTLRWLRSVPGGLAGSWFEFYGERLAPPFPQVGIVPWTWAELILFFIHHVLGVRPGAGGVHLRPRLLSGMTRVEARLPIGSGWLELTLNAEDTAPIVSTVIAHTAGTTRMTIPVRTLS